MKAESKPKFEKVSWDEIKKKEFDIWLNENTAKELNDNLLLLHGLQLVHHDNIWWIRVFPSNSLTVQHKHTKSVYRIVGRAPTLDDHPTFENAQIWEFKEGVLFAIHPVTTETLRRFGLEKEGFYWPKK